MNKWSKRMILACLTAIVVLTSACGDGTPSASDGGSKQPDPAATNQTETKTESESSAESKTETNTDTFDPFRMPEPIEVTTFKSVSAGAKLNAGETVEDNQYTKYIKDKTNISFNILWHASGPDFDQKSKLAISSGDIPDILFVNELTFLSLAEAGQIEDLTEVFEKYASPLTKELYASTNNRALDKAKYQGKLMAIPNISVQADAASLLWVRKDWMDKLGLKPPASADDIATIAKAFVEGDPDGNGKPDTIGLTGSDGALSVPGKAGHHNYKGLFMAYNAYPGNWIKDSSGSIVYGSILPETKQALGKIREWYAAGLIDKEFALRKDLNQPVIGGQAGMFFGPWWSGGMAADTMTNNPKAEFEPYLIPDANGQYNNLMVPVSNRFIVVKKGMKHPEAAVIYANTFIAAQRKADPDALKLDFTVSAEYWPIGNATFDYADAVERKSETLKKALAGEIKPEDLNPEMKQLYDNAVADKAIPKADLKVWRSFYGYTAPAELLKQPMNQVYSEFTATTKTMERKWENLQKLEKETFLKIVMGEKELDAFDQFVADWKAQGGDEITKEVQEEVSKLQK
ncbi:extracellular solute-binding protein [Paenibacillus alkalitolerans]|uniref:extracellular solute-binding protein n=1 Tax=Paenibacillus alkalitolerans TaxID=2799335 RepID=UPI0018F3435E|nr:extracellular solute-binding protein [Paenibacillus alkalitolerans]